MIGVGLPYHELDFCTRKTLKPKSHKHNKILLWSLKHYIVEDFKETSEKMHFPDHLQYGCVNVAFSDFINKFVRASNSVAPIKKVRVKANSKPWSGT